MIEDVWRSIANCTWMRYELAKKYGVAERMCPIIFLLLVANRWGQDWTEMIKVEGLDIDPISKTRGQSGL
jgi:peptidyl-dipeptidase A